MSIVLEKVLDIADLEVRYQSDGGEVIPVHRLSFELHKGSCYGLVGESGCGKTTVGLAIMRHLGEYGRISEGKISFKGRNLAEVSLRELRNIRGSQIAMIYQDAATALNPTMTIGNQLAEVLLLHTKQSKAERTERVIAMLRAVGIPDAEKATRRYPHQMSGGQQQRVVIAMAFLAKPDLLILDEPTTALDVTVEAEIVDLLKRMQAEHGTTMLFVSHNLGLIRRVADRVGVMYAGKIVEEGPVHQVLEKPRHPYTKGLISCLPRIDAGRQDYSLSSIPGQVGRLREPPTVCGFIERCKHAVPGICDGPVPQLLDAARGVKVRCHRWSEISDEIALPPALGQQVSDADGSVLQLKHVSKTYVLRPLFALSERSTIQVKANVDINIDLSTGETLAIVGESGCGKSTLGRIVMGLERATDGQVVLLGEDVSALSAGQRSDDHLRNVQMIFQSPDNTLNPSHTVGFILSRAIRKLGAHLPDTSIEGQVTDLLRRVRLPPETSGMTAGQLSGGQRQRVAVARAFAGEPALVVADEPTSALDTSVKTAILELLVEARRRSRTALIFISHDLGVVRYIADRVAVMYLGEIVEVGAVGAVFQPPYHPYTEVLLSTVPLVEDTIEQRQIRMQGDMPSVLERPPGCSFATRCPRKLGDICSTVAPPLQDAGQGHFLRCHIPLSELMKIAPVFRPSSSLQ